MHITKCMTVISSKSSCYSDILITSDGVLLSYFLFDHSQKSGKELWLMADFFLPTMNKHKRGKRKKEL